MNNGKHGGRTRAPFTKLMSRIPSNVCGLRATDLFKDSFYASLRTKIEIPHSFYALWTYNLTFNEWQGRPNIHKKGLITGKTRRQQLVNNTSSPKRQGPRLTRRGGRPHARPPTSACHQGIRSDRPSAIDFWTESEYILDASRPECISRAAQEGLLHILPRRPQRRLIVSLLEARSSRSAVILEDCFVATVWQQCHSRSSPTPGREINRIFSLLSYVIRVLSSLSSFFHLRCLF